MGNELIKKQNEYLLHGAVEGDVVVTEMGYCADGLANPFYKWRILKNDTIHYIFKGRGVLYLGEKKYKVKQQQLFYVPKGVSCKYYCDKDAPWSYVWISYSGKIAERLVTELNIKTENPVLDCYGVYQIEKEFENIRKRLESDDIRYLSSLSKFYSVLDVFYNVNNLHRVDEKDVLISKIENIVSNCFSDENFSVEELSKKLYLSHSFVSRVFKEKKGESLKHYIIRVRMQNAYSFVIKTQFSFKEIAGFCGYSNYEHFLKEFKRFFGINARACRNSLKYNETRK